MKRKKYYKSSKKITKQEEKFLALVVVIVFFGIYSFYNSIIKPNIDEIILILKIFIPILVIIIWLITYYIFKRKKQKEQERTDSMPSLILEIEEKIRKFIPLRYYNEEKMYQIELAWFLKSHYPDLDIEQARDYSRPDIVMWDIAIEIKWPTSMSWLKSLPDKINSYLPKWEYLLIVLFNINIVDDEVENIRIYKEKKQQIVDNMRDDKKDKVIFIEINS